LADLLQIVRGPDFPTGGYIYGKAGIVEAYRKGRGRFVMRAKAATEQLSSGKQAIIVTEIPYQVNKAKLIERIAELVNEKTIDDIERHVGLGRVALFHLNDSKKPLGSRVDRHENIGEGQIGIEGFRLLINDARSRGIPKFLETPKKIVHESDRRNLHTLRALFDG